MKNKKTTGLYIKLSTDEAKLVECLREEHAVNISQAVRNFLKDLAGRMSGCR